MNQIIAIILISAMTLLSPIIPINNPKQDQLPENTVTTSGLFVSGIEDNEKQESIVYRTKTGKKYHSYGCRYLHSSCIEITLEKAKTMRLTPCLICKP